MDTFNDDNEGYEEDDIIDTNIDEDQPDRFVTPRTSDDVIPKTTRLQSDEIKKQKIDQLARHLGISKYDSNLIDLSRISIEKSQSGLILMKYLKNNGEWVYITNRRTGDFLSDSSLYNILGGSSGLRNFLVTDEESIRLKKTRSAARKLNEILPIYSQNLNQYR